MSATNSSAHHRRVAHSETRQRYETLLTALLYQELVNAWSSYLIDQRERRKLAEHAYPEQPWRTYIAPEAEEALDVMVSLIGSNAVQGFIGQAEAEATNQRKTENAY